MQLSYLEENKKNDLDYETTQVLKAIIIEFKKNSLENSQSSSLCMLVSTIFLDSIIEVFCFARVSL